MKVLQIIENMDERYGGPAKTVAYACAHLAQMGTQTVLHSVQFYPSETNQVLADSTVHWKRHPLVGVRSLAFSPGLLHGVRSTLADGADVIHCQNLWNFPPYAGYTLHRQSGKPLVVSLRGSLFPWSLRQRRIAKRILWHFFQGAMLNRAVCVHATNTQEMAAVRACGVNVPVAIIGNAVDVTEFAQLPTRDAAVAALGLPAGRRYALFMSRLHPKKGVDLLARSWRRVAAHAPEWDLLIAGPEGDRRFMREISGALGTGSERDRVHFTGMLGQRRRLDAYAAAELFVLPSHTENFGVVIAEALAASVAVLTTTGTPWPQIAEQRAGWWIDLNQEKLDKALREALSSNPRSLQEMGRRGATIVQSHFTWHQKARDFKTMYEWIGAGGPKPEFVHHA